MLLAFLLLKVTVKSSEEPHSARERRRARPWIGAPLPPEVIYVCVWPPLQTQLKKKRKKKATFAWRTARRGAARVSDAPSIFVSLMWPRSPGEVITALLVNGRHAWLARGGAGLINEQRAFRPHSRFVIFTPFTPPTPPRPQPPPSNHDPPNSSPSEKCVSGAGD